MCCSNRGGTTQKSIGTDAYCFSPIFFCLLTFGRQCRFLTYNLVGGTFGVEKTRFVKCVFHSVPCRSIQPRTMPRNAVFRPFQAVPNPFGIVARQSHKSRFRAVSVRSLWSVRWLCAVCFLSEKPTPNLPPVRLYAMVRSVAPRSDRYEKKMIFSTPKLTRGRLVLCRAVMPSRLFFDLLFQNPML